MTPDRRYGKRTREGGNYADHSGVFERVDSYDYNQSFSQRGGSGRSSGGAHRSYADRSSYGERSSYAGRSASAGYGRHAKQSQYAKARKSRKRKHVLIVALIVVLALVVVGVGAAFAYVNHINDNLGGGYDWDTILPTSDRGEQIKAEDPFFMLLLGIDKSQNRTEGGESDLYGASDSNFRSDTMILARVDPQQKTVTLMSIQRDIVVDIPGHGAAKINSAYAYGGPELVVSCVSSLCDVQIDHYAEVDIDGIQQIVDDLGGIDVNVEMSFYDPYLDGSLEGGLQTLNGEDAMLYARARHAFDEYGPGDVYRAKHQREVITAIATKLNSTADVASMVSCVETMSNCITTDLTVDQLVTIAKEMRGMDTTTGIYSAMTPTYGVYDGHLWTEELYTDDFNKMMALMKEGKDPNTYDDDSNTAGTSGTKTVVVKNGSGVTGVAETAAETLTAAGYTTQTGNADATDYPQTLVIYNDASQAAEAQQIASLLGKGVAQQNDGVYNVNGDFLVVIGADWS